MMDSDLYGYGAFYRWAFRILDTIFKGLHVGWDWINYNFDNMSTLDGYYIAMFAERKVR